MTLGLQVASLADPAPKLCATADWALLSKEMFYKAQLITLDRAIEAITLAYFAIPIWSFTMTLVKTSIVLTLLRLPLKRAWAVVLYVVLGLQVSYFIANTIYLFAKCRPYHAAWDFRVAVRHCPSEQTDVIVSSIGSAINIGTDLLLSIAPVFILWNLRRPLRERVLICSLTSIGLFATFASIMKAVVIAEWTDTEDRWSTAISIATWTVTEQFVSILAACSPSLKKPIEKVLDKLGFPLVEQDPNISFVHMPSRMRERDLRRQAREWMGDEETQNASDTTSGMGKHDEESLGEKAVSTSTSTSGSSGSSSNAIHKDA